MFFYYHLRVSQNSKLRNYQSITERLDKETLGEPQRASERSWCLDWREVIENHREVMENHREVMVSLCVEQQYTSNPPGIFCFAYSEKIILLAENFRETPELSEKHSASRIKKIFPRKKCPEGHARKP
mgnify:CR=1